MSEARNKRKSDKAVPKEEQNYTILENGIYKVIPWKEYKENYLEADPVEVPAEAE